VWTDYPSSPTAAANLVNDLDLTVVGPDATTYLGNVFSSGWSAVGGSPDRVNNVENVFVTAAASGTWTVLVSGYNVPMGPQPFALVVGDGPASDGLPVVRVSVEDGTATEAGSSPGVLRVTRTGDTSTSLTVHYTVSGTASAGIDFEPLQGSVDIPGGAAGVVVPVVPLDDDLVEAGESATITLSASAAYAVGSPASATVTIVSDDLPPDLVVTQVSGPSTAAAGSAITTSDTTKNQGTANTPASETGFYLSANHAVDALDVFLGSRLVGALAAGASDTSTSTFLVPESTPPGAYYLLAKADWTEQVPETNDANNTSAGSIVRVGPDLIVSAVTVPPTAAPGATVLVGDTTKNQGGGSASGSATGFYLSANASWEVSDLRLGWRPVTALAGGAASTASTAVTIPVSIAPGRYYVIVKADADEVVAESTETNNVRAATVLVGADLVVAALTAPAAAAPGETITVSETTRNTGGADAPDSRTGFYLSMNTSVDASDLPIGARDVPPLAGGASNAATVTLTIPAATPAGTYYIVAVADTIGEVAETSEANNQRASSVVRIGPDLIVSALTAPATAEAGAAVTVTESVKNQGGADSVATESAIYLSANGSLDASDVELGRRHVPPLAPGASHSASLSLVLPASLAPGSYYVMSLVDPGLLVAESTETNNLRTSSVVRVGPDLTVSALTGPAAIARGGTIVVTDTTRNQGGGAAGPSITRLYLSRDGTVDASDVLLGARGVGALAAGASSQSATSLTIPAGTAPGTYYVVARADDEGVVTETSESNNVRATRLRVDP
jgi:subtilase family serine protease